MISISVPKSSNMATLKNLKRYGKIRDNTKSISTGRRSDERYKFSEKATSHQLDYHHLKLKAEVDIMKIEKTKYENTLVALNHVDELYTRVRNEVANVLNAATHKVLSTVIVDVADRFREMHAILEQVVEDEFTYTNQNNPIGAFEYAMEGLSIHFDRYAADWPTRTNWTNEQSKSRMKHLFDDMRNYLNPGTRDLKNEALVQVGIEIKTLEENIAFSQKQILDFNTYSHDLLDADMEKEAAILAANKVKKELQINSINLFSTSRMQSNVQLFELMV